MTLSCTLHICVVFLFLVIALEWHCEISNLYEKVCPRIIEIYDLSTGEMLRCPCLYRGLPWLFFALLEHLMFLTFVFCLQIAFVFLTFHPGCRLEFDVSREETMRIE